MEQRIVIRPIVLVLAPFEEQLASLVFPHCLFSIEVNFLLNTAINLFPSRIRQCLSNPNNLLEDNVSGSLHNQLWIYPPLVIRLSITGSKFSLLETPPLNVLFNHLSSEDNVQNVRLGSNQLHIFFSFPQTDPSQSVGSGLDAMLHLRPNWYFMLS